MASQIPNVSLAQQLLTGPNSTTNSTSGADFREFLLNSIDQVNGMQQDADKAVESLLSDGDVNPSQVLIAVQKADMSFRMMQQVRNKLVQAYQEIKDIRI